MPLIRNPLAAVELVRRRYPDHPEASRAASSSTSIDIPEWTDRQSLLPNNSLSKTLKQRADAMWMRPSTRQRVQAALDQLEGIMWDITGLVSPRLLPALIDLHQLKVFDLHACGNPQGRQNAIDRLADFFPDLPVAEEFGWQVDLPQCLKALAGAGISPNGHRDARQPPLVRALHRADGDAWVDALLQAGADPLQRTFDDLTPGAGKISCLGLAVRRGHERAANLMIDALLPANQTLSTRVFAALVKGAIEADCVALFCRLEIGHGPLFPGAAARALIENARQIGPRMAGHLAQTYVQNQTALARARSLPPPAQPQAPEDASSILRLTSGNRVILTALSRVVELDQPDRIREIRSALYQANTSEPNPYTRKLFNALLNNALAASCTKAATALLGDTPAANLRHGFEIEDPVRTLEIIGTLSAKERATLLPRVCAHILQAPDGAATAQRLRENIEELLPFPPLAEGALTTALVSAGMSLASHAGAAYWLYHCIEQFDEARNEYANTGRMGADEDIRVTSAMFTLALTTTIATGAISLSQGARAFGYFNEQHKARAYRDALLAALTPPSAEV